MVLLFWFKGTQSQSVKQHQDTAATVYFTFTFWTLKWHSTQNLSSEHQPLTPQEGNAAGFFFCQYVAAFVLILITPLSPRAGTCVGVHKLEQELPAVIMVRSALSKPSLSLQQNYTAEDICPVHTDSMGYISLRCLTAKYNGGEWNSVCNTQRMKNCIQTKSEVNCPG